MPISPDLFSLLDCRLRALYLTGTQASGAYVDVTGRTLDDRLNTLYIGLPCSVSQSMGMGNLVTKSYTLTANFALCHLGYTSFKHVEKHLCHNYSRYSRKKQAFFSFLFKKILRNQNSVGIAEVHNVSTVEFVEFAVCHPAEFSGAGENFMKSLAKNGAM